MSRCSQILLVLQDVPLDQGLHLISFSPRPDCLQIIQETARTTNIDSSSGRTHGIILIRCRKDTTPRTLTADLFFWTDQHLILHLFYAARIIVASNCQHHAQGPLYLAAYAVKIRTDYYSQDMKMQQHSTILILVYWRKQWNISQILAPHFRVILIYNIYSIGMESERPILVTEIYPASFSTFLFFTSWCYWVDL